MSCNVRPDFEIRQGDHGRSLTVKVKDANGALFDIPVGTTATFRMVGRETGHVVTGTATVDASADTLSYAFASGDTDVADAYDAVFQATLPGGAVETFPTCSGSTTGFVVEVCPAI